MLGVRSSTSGTDIHTYKLRRKTASARLCMRLLRLLGMIVSMLHRHLRVLQLKHFHEVGVRERTAACSLRRSDTSETSQCAIHMSAVETTTDTTSFSSSISA